MYHIIIISIAISCLCQAFPATTRFASVEERPDNATIISISNRTLVLLPTKNVAVYDDGTECFVLHFNATLTWMEDLVNNTHNATFTSSHLQEIFQVSKYFAYDSVGKTEMDELGSEVSSVCRDKKTFLLQKHRKHIRSYSDYLKELKHNATASQKTGKFRTKRNSRNQLHHYNRFSNPINSYGNRQGNYYANHQAKSNHNYPSYGQSFLPRNFQHYNRFNENREIPAKYNYFAQPPTEEAPPPFQAVYSDPIAPSEDSSMSSQFPDVIVKDGTLFYRHDDEDTVNSEPDSQHGGHDDQQVDTHGYIEPNYGFLSANANIPDASSAHSFGAASNGGYFGAPAVGYDQFGDTVTSQVHGTGVPHSLQGDDVWNSQERTYDNNAPGNWNSTTFLPVYDTYDHRDSGYPTGRSHGVVGVAEDYASDNTLDVVEQDFSLNDASAPTFPIYNQPDIDYTLPQDQRGRDDSFRDGTDMFDSIMEHVHQPGSIPVQEDHFTAYPKVDHGGLSGGSGHTQGKAEVEQVSGEILPEGGVDSIVNQKEGVTGVVTYADVDSGKPPGPGELLTHTRKYSSIESGVSSSDDESYDDYSYQYVDAIRPQESAINHVENNPGLPITEPSLEVAPLFPTFEFKNMMDEDPIRTYIAEDELITEAPALSRPQDTIGSYLPASRSDATATPDRALSTTIMETRFIVPGDHGTITQMSPLSNGKPSINVITLNKDGSRHYAPERGVSLGPRDKIPGSGYQIPSGFRARVFYGPPPAGIERLTRGNQMALSAGGNTRNIKFAQQSNHVRRSDEPHNSYRRSTNRSKPPVGLVGHIPADPVPKSANFNDNCGYYADDCQPANSPFESEICKPVFIDMVCCC